MCIDHIWPPLLLRYVDVIMLTCKVWRTCIQCVKTWGHVQTRHASSQTTQLYKKYPVIIAGAGPSGLTLALWLARYGIRSLLLEKATALSTHPQAHYINNRTLEVFRPLNGLSDAITAACPPLDHWRSFRYCLSMTGELLGEVDHFAGQTSPHNEAISPEAVSHLPQSRLLPLMMQRVTSAGSLTSVLWGHMVKSVALREDGVVVSTTDNDGKQHTFHGSFLAAADGAHSVIRQQLGIGMQGMPAMQHLINIHFMCPSLGSLLMGQAPAHPETNSKSHHTPGHAAGDVENKAAMLYFVFNKDVVGVVVAHDLEQGEFVVQVPYFPPLQTVQDFPETHCKQLVAAAAGLPLSQLQDLKILQARPWTMSAVVAESFQYPVAPHNRQQHQQPILPRVFLVGDAAHRFPPAGGFGMNTGVQDAHNLAWKLALVLQQQAAQVDQQPPQHAQLEEPNNQQFVNPAHLLSSYQAERQPVAQANSALSIQNWKEAVGVPSLLGLNPKAADLLNSAVNAVPLPSIASKALLEAGLSFGRNLATAWTPARPLQLAKIKQLFESGDTLRLQYPKEDLGFRYNPDTPGVAIAKCDTRSSAEPVVTHINRSAPYVPNTDPGCRLPHCWLQDISPQEMNLEPGHKQQQSCKQAWVSTLDVVSGYNPSSKEHTESKLLKSQSVQPYLTLFIDSHGGKDNPWQQAWARLAASYPSECFPVTAVCVYDKAGGRVDYMNGNARIMLDVNSCWHKNMQVARGSVVLVRPDGHVCRKHSIEQLAADQTEPMNQNKGSSAVDIATHLLLGAIRSVLNGCFDDAVS